MKSYVDNVLLHLDKASGETLLTFLKQDFGKSNRDSIAVEIDKLNAINPLRLTASIFPAATSLLIR